MERTLYAERLYALGDFKNIKFSSALTQIPEEIARNPEAINLLYVDMFIGMELAYRRYYAMVESLSRSNVQEVIESLKTEQTRNFGELQSKFGADKAPELITTKKETD